VVTIGITGGLGSGKSTACQRLKEKGAIVFDADTVAKELLKRTDIQEQLIDEFGADIIHNGNIDTAKLAKVAFSSEKNQTVLNNIIHPLVIDQFEQLRDEVSDKEELLVMDAPLIFESGIDVHLDHTILIYSKMKLRIARALRRGNLSREQILQRMALQMPEEEKRELASFVIENNGSIEQLYASVDKLYSELIGD